MRFALLSTLLLALSLPAYAQEPIPDPEPASGEGQQPPAVQLTVELVDGSRLRCTTRQPTLTLLVLEESKVHVPLRKVATIAFDVTQEKVRVTMADGDTLTGVAVSKTLAVTSLLGEHAIALGKLRLIEVHGVMGVVDTTPARGGVARHLGMTWVVKSTVRDLVCVGHDKQTKAYGGDTPATASLPILAVRKRNLPRPGYLPRTTQYYKWSGAEVRCTRPVRGERLTSLAEANRIVREQLGDGWQMASFHDGWAWNFWGKGTLPPNVRFWVQIRDQRANCWDDVRK